MLTIYTKDDCPYCIKTKEYLTQNDIPYEEINVKNDPEALTFIKGRGHTTVPQIYRNGEIFIEGGYTGLINFDIDVLRAQIVGLH